MYHCQIFTRKCMLLKGTIVHHPLLCSVLCVELLYHVLHFAAAPLESLKTVLCSKMSGLHCSALLCQLCITMSISMQCAMNQSCMLCTVSKRWDSGAVHTAADREVKEEGGGGGGVGQLRSMSALLCTLDPPPKNMSQPSDLENICPVWYNNFQQTVFQLTIGPQEQTKENFKIAPNLLKRIVMKDGNRNRLSVT